MKHYVMTKAYRGPDYPLDASRRRIDLCRGITARSLAAQGGDWTWLVYVHPDDPLLEERIAAFDIGRPVVLVFDNAGAEEVIDWSGPVLTTRIDDDDAFAVGAFDRLRRAVGTAPHVPTAYIFPVGYHVRDGHVAMNRHLRNAWSSVYSPVGFREHALTHQHQRIPGAYPVVYVDSAPAWLRVSHEDNERPTSHRPRGSITASVRRLFPVDWDALAPRVAA